MSPECPQCHRRSLVDNACPVCAYNSDKPRPCGCVDSEDCDACCELSVCNSCGEDGIPIRVLFELEGLCPRCSGIEMARDAAIDRKIDEMRDER